MYEEWNHENQTGENLNTQNAAGSENYTYNAGTGYGGGSDNGVNNFPNSPYGTGSSIPPEKDPKQKKAKKKKEGKGVGKLILGGAAFGLTAAVVFCGTVGVARYTFLKPDTAKEASAVAGTEQKSKDDTKQIDSTVTATAMPATNKAAGTELSVAQIAQNVMPSIVSITNKSVSEVRSLFGTREYEAVSAGSGIIIGQNDTELLIATNNHVVEDANSLSVCFGDSEEAVYEAQIKGTKADNDLAIIAVKLDDIDQEVKDSIKIATIGSSDDLQIGEGVVAIGNALGYGQSVTQGIVSALNREVTIENLSAKLIQTDAAINPGNSGGALLNMKGELIGINSAKFASSEVEGMGYAIPINTAQPILEELMMRETRDKLDINESGFLGINCQNVDSEVSEMYDIPKGVYVLSVTDGGAADKAGIKKGDIITSFDGVTITSRDELKNTLLYYAPGETVDVIIKRSGDGGYKEVTVSVTLDRNTLDSDDKGSSSENYPEEEQQQADPYGNSGQYGGDLRDFFDQFYGNW
ncbi:MAG: PDZ domain-containing protein [Lachnospiraceae bacterium]|nr:PDZ domain-containing protein [Lachnospiraceae bacterium]